MDDQRDYAEEEFQRRHVEQENAAELEAERNREYGHAEGTDPNEAENARLRLEYLRGCLRAESISWGEILELQSLVPFIHPHDAELLEAAGVPEFPGQEDSLHTYGCSFIFYGDDRLDALENRIIAALETEGLNFDPMTVTVERTQTGERA